ncbi:MAG: GNAT family N-acetyltransferase [Methylococcaceae bacterium]|nr:GNAT family N-acetyltransferase [Methylococcaceae bacterium]
MNTFVNAISFSKVINAGEIATVVTLADEIWNAHYVPIIGQSQVKYMLRTFQSKEAINKQINESFTYFIVNKDNFPVAYFAITELDDSKKVQISKIYVKQSAQKKGIGLSIIKFIETYCLRLGAAEIWLTVNINNKQAIKFYQKVGFKKMHCLVQDIGNGFVMDDYLMSKSSLH